MRFVVPVQIEEECVQKCRAAATQVFFSLVRATPFRAPVEVNFQMRLKSRVNLLLIELSNDVIPNPLNFVNLWSRPSTPPPSSLFYMQSRVLQLSRSATYCAPAISTCSGAAFVAICSWDFQFF